MNPLIRWMSMLACALVLAACGGGSDPFYRPPPSGGGATSPFGTTEPVVRPPITAWPAPVRAEPARPRVLVLYDEPEANPYARLGRGYAIMLENLLGHFDARVEMMPTVRYTASTLQQYDATFYLGWATGQEVPQPLLADVLNASKPVVWIRGNLEQLSDHLNADRGANAFRNRFGFIPVDTRWFDEGPQPAGPDAQFFSTVYYKNLAFEKVRIISDGRLYADAEVLITEVIDPAKARVHAVIGHPASGVTAPYATQSGNFWFVADLPLTFTSPRDRYLVFADLLHDMLGIHHEEKHQAMIRLEDIDAKVDPQAFTQVVNYLHSKGVPFSMATIVRYKDPFGAQNNGVAQDIPLAKATNLRLALDYGLARGGEILQHGYTHQYETRINNVSGASGIDYEFWDAVNHAPLPGDSLEWALGRVNAGLRELLDLGYRPVAWETPHYHGSPSTLRAVAQVHQSAYQRHTYYTSEHPNLAPGIGGDFELWQFFPYVIERDHFGLRVLPENLGNLQYFQFGVDEELTSADILRNARYAKAVRDGFASFFFHPFLLVDTNNRGMEDLVRIVEGLTEMGYTWTSPSRLNGQ